MPKCYIASDHTLSFTADTLKERVRLSFRFFRMTASMVFKGNSRLTIQRKQKHGKDATAEEKET